MVGDTGWKRNGWIALFILPSMAGMLLFVIGPIIASAVLTFFEWDLLTDPEFIGLGNFRRLIHDQVIWDALRHTLAFIIGYVPSVMVLGLLLALILNARLKGLAIFRTAFFLPVVSSWVAVALLWKWLFNPRYGLINYGLEQIGITGPKWLFDSTWAMPAIVITSVWKDLGFVAVLFLAGLQAIPADVYEASSLDGAGKLEQLRSITVPLLKPTIFFISIISIINSFQVFPQVWIMTEGGPAGSTNTVPVYIYVSAFKSLDKGYASAVAVLLLVLLIAYAVALIAIRRLLVRHV